MVYRNQPWCIIIAKDCLVGNGYILVVNLLNFVVQVVSNILVRNDQWFEHVLVTH